MKTEDKNNEMDINEMVIAIEVESEVIDKVLKGEITHILMDINEDNQNLLLENADGHLALAVDDMPMTYHGCYLYNNGDFPYVIKDSVTFLELNCGKECHSLLRIIDIDMEPGIRFNYQGAGKPIVEDANGDSCVWELSFEVVPIPEEPKIYLMRWNPFVSSFTENDYEECLENQVHGMFRMNWSIHEWQEARRGDMFYMLRTGDSKAGIVFNGQFISDPYPADDWAGSTKRRMYVDIVCINPVEAGSVPDISLDKLRKAIPAFEWSKGHSGTLLPKEVVTQIDELYEKEENDGVTPKGEYLN